MYTSKLLLLAFVFLTVWWSFVNITKAVHGDRMPWGNFILNAIGITGIIAYYI